MIIKEIINWKIFWVLFTAGMFGVVAIFPFLLTTQGDILRELPISLSMVLLVSAVQSSVLIGVATFVGLRLGKRIGFGTPLISSWLSGELVREKIKSVARVSIKLGVLSGVLIIGFDYIFNLFIDPISTAGTPLWQGFLASFYGGVVEEILLRLFFVTLLVWIMCKFSKSENIKPSATTIWIAIISASVIFGLGHLPATASLTTITPVIILRAVLLNGIGGVIFGWLYWKKGLESAIIAHFTTDIILLTVFPLLLNLN
jgi:membrane protease YdiL (CAAX protease family)